MNKAFTLVEIIIVIMIMSLFLGVGFNTYTSQIQSRELDRQVDAFVTTLELAKSKAVARDISYNSACTTFDRYEVRVWNSPTQFRMRLICNVGATNGDRDLQLQTFNNMTITVAANPTDIQFHHPYGCTNDACTAPIQSVTICNLSTKCKTVTVNSLGNISVN